MMRLFQFEYSPYAAKVRLACAVKRLPLEVVEVPYARREDLVALSDGVGVPVLDDGGHVVADSARIVAHLEARGGPLLRADPLALVLEQWSDGPLEDPAFRLACPGIEARIGRAQGREAQLLFRLIKERRYGTDVIARWKQEEAQWADATCSALAPVVDALRSREWVLPSGLSVADVAIAGQLFMIEWAHPGFVAKRLPGLLPWVQRLEAFGAPVCSA